MKKEYDKKKKLVIFILTAVAVCLAGGLCFYLVKIGTPKEPEKPQSKTDEYRRFVFSNRSRKGAGGLKAGGAFLLRCRR